MSYSLIISIITLIVLICFLPLIIFLGSLIGLNLKLKGIRSDFDKLIDKIEKNSKISGN